MLVAWQLVFSHLAKILMSKVLMRHILIDFTASTYICCYTYNRNRPVKRKHRRQSAATAGALTLAAGDSAAAPAVKPRSHKRRTSAAALPDAPADPAEIRKSDRVRTVKRKYEDDIEEDISDDLACLAPLPRATSGFKASPAFTVKRAKKSLSAPSQRTIGASANVSRGGAAEPKFVSPTPPDEPAFAATFTTSSSSSSRRNSDFMTRTTPALAYGSNAGYPQQQQYQKAQQTPVWSGYDRAMLPGFYSPAVAYSASTPASAVRGGFSLSQGSADGGSTFGLGSVSSSATTASASGDGGGGRFAAARRRVRFNAVTSPTPGSSSAGSMTAATAATANTTSAAAAAAAAASGATGSAASLAVSSPWQPRSDAELVWQWSQISGGASPAMVLQSPVSTAAFGYSAGWQQQQQQLYNRAVPSTSMMASPSPRSPLQRRSSVNAGSSGSGSSSCSRISSLLAASALLSGHSNSGGSDENSQ
jgi:hypothetical protein